MFNPSSSPRDATHPTAQAGDRSNGSAAQYVAGLSFEDFVAMTKFRHPRLHGLLDPHWQCDGRAQAEVDRLNVQSWEFEGQTEGGRGNDYNLAQRNIDNRHIGMTRLLRLFGEDGDTLPGPRTVILDVLAGDGTLRRFCERFGGTSPEIISADMSRLMVDACLAQGYPSIRQSASKSFLKDAVLDGVLIAYGSHHLTNPERREAAREAHRTLRRGGRFVLHDFETNGPVDRWFREVVDPFSATGHPHPHFSADEMRQIMSDAGFRDAKVQAMEDPFVLTGDTPQAARRTMLQHLRMMYGLVRLTLESDADWDRLEALAADTLGEMTIRAVDRHYEATLMRDALVAVGIR
jgi:Methylase involved in ubiquinone/menaquinone biosynthesis